MAVHDVERLTATPASPTGPSHRHALELRGVVDANEDFSAAKGTRIDADIAAAHHRLQDAVDSAREAGVGWTQIGDALGIRRGNAYQKFRRRAPGA